MRGCLREEKIPLCTGQQEHMHLKISEVLLQLTRPFIKWQEYVGSSQVKVRLQVLQEQT